MQELYLGAAFARARKRSARDAFLCALAVTRRRDLLWAALHAWARLAVDAGRQRLDAARREAQFLAGRSQE